MAAVMAGRDEPLMDLEIRGKEEKNRKRNYKRNFPVSNAINFMSSCGVSCVELYTGLLM